MLPGTVDPFNDKALRAAKGATFFLPLYSGTWQELQALCKQDSIQIFVSAIDGKDLCNTQVSNSIALVLGNEAKGVKAPSTILYDTVRIPMASSMDSLNVAVAAGILMYHFKSD